MTLCIRNIALGIHSDICNFSGFLVWHWVHGIHFGRCSMEPVRLLFYCFR